MLLGMFVSLICKLPTLSLRRMQRQCSTTILGSSYHIDNWVLQFDGGSRGNPGVAGAGAALFNQTTENSALFREVWAGSYYLGDNQTNNFAEYMGLIEGLRQAIEMKLPTLEVQGDSQLVIRQMLREYRVINPGLQVLHRQAGLLANQVPGLTYKHIERSRNSRADALANMAMTSKSSSSLMIENGTLVELAPMVIVPTLVPSQNRKGTTSNLIRAMKLGKQKKSKKSEPK